MSSSILAQVCRAIANNIDDNALRISIADFLSHYRKGQWLYPAVLVQKFKCSLGTSYRIMHDLENDGILKSFYEIVCPCCSSVSGKVEVFNEIPDCIICEHCSAEFSAIENSRIIFQVMYDVK